MRAALRKNMQRSVRILRGPHQFFMRVSIDARPFYARLSWSILTVMIYAKHPILIIIPIATTKSKRAVGEF